jgi:hypothetical protein
MVSSGMLRSVALGSNTMKPRDPQNNAKEHDLRNTEGEPRRDGI